MPLLCALPLTPNDLTRALEGLVRIFPYGETDGEHAGVKQEDAVSGALTLNFGVLSYADGVLRGGADLRCPVCATRESVKAPFLSVLRAAGFSGKKKQAQYAGAARIWGAGAAASILSLIASTDMDIRSGGTMLEDTSLVLLLHGIIIKNGVYPAKYE